MCLAFLTQGLSIIMQNKSKKQVKKIFCHINFTHLFFIRFSSAILQPTELPSVDSVMYTRDTWKVLRTIETYLDSSAYLPSICEEFRIYEHCNYTFYAFEKNNLSMDVYICTASGGLKVKYLEFF
jgi:hypothetical protein